MDTGLSEGTPEEVMDKASLAYTGKDICTYMEAFLALGYKPEQVTKILLTHRHADHCGYVYDPAEHDGVPFEDLPDDWKCPRCKQPKSKFNKA